MAPIVAALQQSSALDCVVAVTGQHREMLDQVNELFEIIPDYDLDIFLHHQTLADIAARTMTGLQAVFRASKPDAVMVQGDTTTSTAAAMAAFYHGIPVVHVEAGLRSGNPLSPFPEEGNRKMTSQIASLHLAPTQTSRENLLAENIPAESVVVTGNTVIDALLATVNKDVAFADQRLEALVSHPGRVLLVTTHRRENQGHVMQGIGRAVAKIADAYPDLTLVLPLHRNPAVRNAILPAVRGRSNVVTTEPLGYGEFTKLLALSDLVLTDSGGVQEEAPSLGKPVLVMRENTERPEAVSAGTVELVGTGEDGIFDKTSLLLNDEGHFQAMARATNPYGDGRAAARTVAAVEEMLNVGVRQPDFLGGLVHV